MESVCCYIESQVLSFIGFVVGGVDFELLKGDLGLFGFDVVCWKVYGDFSSMMIGGIGVLFLQMFYLLVLVGVWDYFNFCDDLFGCLCCIGQFILVIIYGLLVDVE